jgi:hypothetical protein
MPQGMLDPDEPQPGRPCLRLVSTGVAHRCERRTGIAPEEDVS